MFSGGMKLNTRVLPKMKIFLTIQVNTVMLLKGGLKLEKN